MDQALISKMKQGYKNCRMLVFVLLPEQNEENILVVIFEALNGSVSKKGVFYIFLVILKRC